MLPLQTCQTPKVYLKPFFVLLSWHGNNGIRSHCCLGICPSTHTNKVTSKGNLGTPKDLFLHVFGMRVEMGYEENKQTKEKHVDTGRTSKVHTDRRRSKLSSKTHPHTRVKLLEPKGKTRLHNSWCPGGSVVPQ